jgi:ATP-dependent protease ClpP protease subunit
MAGGWLSRFRWRGEEAASDSLEDKLDLAQRTYISFHAEVNQTTTEALISVVGHEMREGRADVHLMLSTPGGSVDNGIAIYNTLRGLPIRLTTYNLGSVNSIGNVIYLAGERRYACPTSSFMFHGVGFDVRETRRFEEKELLEHLEGIRSDQGLIARVIVERTNIDAEEARRLFLRAAFVGAEEAQAKGIVHEIRAMKVPEGAAFLQLVFER